MNILIEMTTLAMSRPAASASSRELSAWYLQKARLHQYIAELGGPDAEREAVYAAAALAHAEALSRQTGSTSVPVAA